MKRNNNNKLARIDGSYEQEREKMIREVAQYNK